MTRAGTDLGSHRIDAVTSVAIVSVPAADEAHVESRLPFYTAERDVSSDRPGRRALGSWTLQQLMEGIFSGKYKPGDQLPEAELTRELGVSRQPVREALRHLEADGLVAAVDRRGERVVVTFDRAHIQELYEIRAALEAISFRSAAAKISVERLELLSDLLAQLEADAAHDLAQGAARDTGVGFRFQEVVCQAAEMPMLYSHLSRAWLQTWALLRQLDLANTYPTSRDVQAMLRDRRTLLDLLKSGEAEQAAAAAHQHVLNRRDEILADIDAGHGTYRVR